jgi:hypothetical protein
MRVSKELVTAAGTLALAVGIGLVMQSSDEAKVRYGEQQPPVPQQVETESVKEASIMPALKGVQLTSAGDVTLRQKIASRTTTAKTVAARIVQTCDVVAQTKVTTGALVNLQVSAPCKSNARVVIHHSGLMFSERTDLDGKLNVTVPAMSRQAVFIVEFDDGDGTVTMASVPEMSLYKRTALQWRGKSTFQLHALEFGADYDTEGHVWSGAVQSVASALEASHGFVVPLGNASVKEPLLAEVYTYPSQEGPVDLRIETEIAANNCGLDIEVQSIAYKEGNLHTDDVVLSIPDCSVMGDLLVLSNLIDHEDVAQN